MSRPRSATLTGAWSGVYRFPGDAQRPVNFSAKLTQDGPWIAGTTEEVAERGEARGVLISATLQGRRDGANVTWLKLYDRMLNTYNEVAYEGHVNEDATEISGQWRIPGDWSGTFLMIRAPARVLTRGIATEERL